jgi:signal peptidase II
LSAGVLGNVTDRIRHHYVVDFLLFNLHVPFADPWPAFNVADSCICIAATLLILSAWLEERKAGGQKQAA